MPGAEREADYTGTHGMFQQTALTVLYRDDDSGYVTICVCQSSENCTPCRENLACVRAKSLHSCLTLCDPIAYPTRFFCPQESRKLPNRERCKNSDEAGIWIQEQSRWKVRTLKDTESGVSFLTSDGKGDPTNCN